MTRTPTNTATRTETATPTLTLTPCGYPGNTCTFTPTATIGLDHFTVSKNIFTPSSPVSISVSINAYYGVFSIKIYNSAGEHIQTIVEKDLTGPEVNTYSWDGKNKGGYQCASGVYVIYMIGSYERKMARVVLINQ
jgi:flagellar hook assembly protein FlgD